MKILINNLKDNARTLIRRAGYGEHYDARSQETSYARRLGDNVFPKFHAYIAEREGGVEVSLHLDQKQPSYGASHMHSGEYDGPLIEKELQRIRDVFVNTVGVQDEPPPEKKKGFFGRLFG
jgi:hypothetical protein